MPKSSHSREGKTTREKRGIQRLAERKITEQLAAEIVVEPLVPQPESLVDRSLAETQTNQEGPQEPPRKIEFGGAPQEGYVEPGIGFDIWPLVLLVSVAVTSYLVLTDDPSTVRLLFTFWFVFFCPGMAYSRLLTKDLVASLIIGVALSVSIATILALAFLYAHAWSPKRIFEILIVLTLIGTLLQVLQVLLLPRLKGTSKSLS